MTNPPGGWRYEDPETGTRWTALHFAGLVNEVKAGLSKLGRPIPIDLERIIKNWLCKQYPPNSKPCIIEEELPATVTHAYTLKDVLSFLASVKDSIKEGTASQAEATYRAGICKSCPYNVAVQGCYGCAGIASTIYNILGKKTTPFDGYLKQCAICGCDNKTKVWVKKEILKSNPLIKGKDFPKHCWQHLPS